MLFYDAYYYSISDGIQYIYSLFISRSVLIKTAVNKYII